MLHLRIERVCRVCLLLVVTSTLGGCGASSKGSGSETHFVTCSKDETCPSDAPYCADGHCSATPASSSTSADSGPPTAATSTTSEMDPSTTSAAEPSLEPSTDVGATSEPILDGGNKPALDAGAQPIDTMPEDTAGSDAMSLEPATTSSPDASLEVGECGADAVMCCGNDGQAVARTCSDDGFVQCPPASALPDAAGECPVCPVPAESGSFVVDFQVTNPSNAPIGLWNGCQTLHRISACIDGYQAALQTFSGCSPLCPSADCPTCGACFDGPLVVNSEAPATIPFDGRMFQTIEQPGCACVNTLEVPAGSYRVTVPVYSDTPTEIPGGGYYRTVLYEVAVDFQLPDADGIVEIPIDVAPYVGACADDAGTCLVTTSPQDTSECALEAVTPNDCPNSAPVRYRCASAFPLEPDCVDPMNGNQDFPAQGGVVRCCPATE